MNWNESVALITGASSGIGLATARVLHDRGVRVALLARSADRLQALVRTFGEARATAFPMDVTDRERLTSLPQRVIDRFGRLDVVINNAGLNHRGPLMERSGDELAAIIETNLIAPMLLTRAALPLMQPGGVIVNVASLAGKIPVPHEAGYSASKAGLRAFARALDLEMADSDRRIRITTVSPGPVSTGFLGEDLTRVPDLVFSQPMSTAEDVARAVIRSIESEDQEIDVPMLSGKLATLGYLSPRMYRFLRPHMEKRGARNKRKYIAARKNP